MKLWTSLVVGITLSLGLPLTVQAQSDSDPVYGTWKLNLAKSTFDPGPAPQSQTRTYEAAPGGSTKVTVQITSASGQTQMVSATFKGDGTPHPVTGSLNYDMISTTRISPLQSKDVLMRSGKVIGQMIRIESSDYKILTATYTFTTPSGRSEHDVMVYDRQ
jgi:hypothetical protein